jgi:hypothetical protein
MHVHWPQPLTRLTSAPPLAPPHLFRLPSLLNPVAVRSSSEVSLEKIAFFTTKGASSFTMSCDSLSFPNCLNGRLVSIVIVPDGGKLLSPMELRSQIMRSLKLIKCQKCFFAHHRAASAAAPWLRCHGIFSVWASASHAPLCGVRVPANGHCACPADMHMAHMSRSWAEVVMERVTRGRMKKVHVVTRLIVLLVTCCSGARAVLCAALVVPLIACTVCLTRAAARKRWLVLRCVATHRKRAAAFILVCRLLLPPGRDILDSCRLGSIRRKRFCVLPCDC